MRLRSMLYRPGSLVLIGNGGRRHKRTQRKASAPNARNDRADGRKGVEFFWSRRPDGKAVGMLCVREA